MLNKDDNYLELLKAIKKTKIDKNYKPKNYKFGLKSFNEKDKKKRESNDSPV